MSDHIRDKPPTETPSYNYPFAAAPDIIRSHQKDAYFESILLSHLSTLLRRIYGARFLHTYTSETHTLSSLLYLSLTTLLGNRTLGEEYTDIIQITDSSLKLPAIGRRAGYILTSILLPYSLGKILPKLRARIRAKLESNLRRMERRKLHQHQHTTQDTASRSYKLQTYLLTHLATLTSPSPLHALTLTIFYFSGAYYELSKRLWGLRYIFSKRVAESEARVGYEVLGVLMVVQMGVQGWVHLSDSLRTQIAVSVPGSGREVGGRGGGTAMIEGGVEIAVPGSVPAEYFTTNDTTLLLESAIPQPSSSPTSISTSTHTPLLPHPRHDLRDNDTTMAYIKGQNRKCTLCLEGLKDPSVTSCGHVFCWECIGDWVREKPECPLCRREVGGSCVLPLRV